MITNRTVRWIIAPVAVMVAVFGVSLALFSQEPGPAGRASGTAGGGLVDELKAIEEEHLSRMRALRHEIRQVLKVVQRARSDKSLAQEAEAAPGLVGGLLNKMLDAETAYRLQREERLIAHRDALVAELAGVMIQGGEAHPGLFPHLLPTIQGRTNEILDWNDLFKVVKRSPRFDEDGDDDEGFD